MLDLLGRWVDDVRIEFTTEEVESILKEFTRVAYGLTPKDVQGVYIVDSKGDSMSYGGARVYIKTKEARPESWAVTYRQLATEGDKK